MRWLTGWRGFSSALAITVLTVMGLMALRAWRNRPPAKYPPDTKQVMPLIDTDTKKPMVVFYLGSKTPAVARPSAVAP